MKKISFDLLTREWMFAAVGFAMGFTAPAAWLMLRLLLFYNVEQGLLEQIIDSVTRDAESTALFLYMGFGTALVMSTCGYLIGRGIIKIRERAEKVTLSLKAKTLYYGACNITIMLYYCQY